MVKRGVMSFYIRLTDEDTLNLHFLDYLIHLHYCKVIIYRHHLGVQLCKTTPDATETQRPAPAQPSAMYNNCPN